LKSWLFMCVANSARSQMAEGLARSLAPEGARVYSAGTRPASVHPLAIRAMAEIGIDLSGHRSKGLDAIPTDEIGTVVTLCADEVCPVFAGDVDRLHWPLPDPAACNGSDEARLQSFRDVRDELARRVRKLFA